MKKARRLEELLRNVKEEKKELTEKLEKKELELQEVLNSFKELQVKLTTYIEKDQSAEENNNKYPDFYKGFYPYK